MSDNLNNEIIITMIKASVHRSKESPIYGEMATHIELTDEGGGEFFEIASLVDEGTGKVRADMDEIDAIIAEVREERLAETRNAR